MSKATYIRTIGVQDPATGGAVDLVVYKHQNGGMFAIDASFIEQLPPLDEDDDIRCKIMDPLSDPSEPDYVILEE